MTLFLRQAFNLFVACFFGANFSIHLSLEQYGWAFADSMLMLIWVYRFFTFGSTA